jgi:DNA-binding transcriptional LysR family regulator
MSELEVRELRYFTAVAQELNFSRAAERLGIAQPPLSKAIRQLEAKLGVRLLERTTRRVTLTEAGRVLLEQGGAALDLVAAAARRAQRAGQPVPRLVVAAKAGDAPLLQEILEVYRAAAEPPESPPPEVVITGWGEPATMLRDGRADVALVRSPFDGRGLDVEPLRTEARVVALAAGHRLAGRRRVPLAELAGEPVPYAPDTDEQAAAYWAGRDPESLAAAWDGQREPARPRLGPRVGDFAQLLEVVALGQAVAFLPASLAERHPRGDVVYRPVDELSPSTLVVAWPQTSRSLAVAAFVRAAAEVAQPPDGSSAGPGRRPPPEAGQPGPGDSGLATAPPRSRPGGRGR